MSKDWQEADRRSLDVQQRAPGNAPARWPWFAWAALLAVFLVAATLNAGGYRYGASDQAFYIPAVLHHADPTLFPRDWTALLAPQDRLNLFTGAVAVVLRTGVSAPAAFFALYVLGLIALFAGAVTLGFRLYRSPWTVVALLAALTLRHAIAMGAVNTLEGYMHPRTIAFGVGALAVGAVLGRRPFCAIPWLVVALALHPTTAIWFVLWVGVALAVRGALPRWLALAGVLVAAAVGAWTLTAGPLSGRLVRMDPAWLSVLTAKRYLFPADWPIGGWLPALVTAGVAGWIYLLRRARGLASRAENGVAAGAAALVAAFLVSVPFTAQRIAFAVQLQAARTLWMVDLLAVVYVVWYLAEGAPWARGTARLAHAARNTALVILALSLARGAYVMFVEHPGRPVVAVNLPAGEWNDAMRWIAANTAKDAWLLAPPGHAWRYGSSARVSAGRDVYLEEVKDTAMAMYSREAALTVQGRVRLCAGFEELSADSAKALAAATGLDLLVTERDLALPVLYRNARFRVYQLK